MSNFATTTSFGIEIETYAPRDTYNIGGYHRGERLGNTEFWNYEDDCSIRPPSADYEVCRHCDDYDRYSCCCSLESGDRDCDVYEYQACEMVSPILRGGAGLNNVCREVGSAECNGSQYNDSCGVHVHIDVDGITGFDLYKLYLYVSNYEMGFYAGTSNLYRYADNYEYSAPIRTSMITFHRDHRPRLYTCPQLTRRSNDFMRARGYLNSGPVKYNPYSADNDRLYGTVEFRHHRPSLNTKQTCNAIMLSLAVVEKALHSRKRPKLQYAPHHGVNTQTRETVFVDECERMLARLGWLPGTFAKNPCGAIADAPYSLRELADYAMRNAQRFQRAAIRRGIV